MDNKQLAILSNPLNRILNLIEDQQIFFKDIHSILTIDLKKASIDNSKELKKQTVLLQDIKDLLKDQIQQKETSKSEKSSKIKMPSMIGGVGVGLAIVTMAAALVVAAGLFSIIPVVSPMQLLTALAIGALFVILTPIFVEISEALNGGGLMKRLIGRVSGVGTGKIESTSAVAMAMITMAAGVTATSLIFQLIQPISFAQFATAALIGLALVPIAYAYSIVLSSLEKANVQLNASGVKKLGMSIVALGIMAAGIALVATIWNSFMPDNFIKLPDIEWILKASILMLVFSYSFSTIAKAVKGMTIKDMIFTGLALPLLAGGIAAVAFMFSYLDQVGAYVAPPVEYA